MAENESRRGVSSRAEQRLRQFHLTYPIILRSGSFDPDNSTSCQQQGIVEMAYGDKAQGPKIIELESAVGNPVIVYNDWTN